MICTGRECYSLFFTAAKGPLTLRALALLGLWCGSSYTLGTRQYCLSTKSHVRLMVRRACGIKFPD